MLLAGLAVLAGCDWSSELGVGSGHDDGVTDTTEPVADTDVSGLALAVSDRSFDATRDALVAAYRERNRYLADVIDHRQRAANVTLELRPTTVYFLDDPNRTAALVAADPRVGLDLPARILVYRDDDGEVGLAYNSGNYLAARFDLADAEDGALDSYDDDLQALVEQAADNAVDNRGSSAGLDEGAGIVSVDSRVGFAATVSNLNTAINADADLASVFTVDFAQRALQIGRALNPSTLFVFGDVSADSRLMQAGQTAGIDLPEKMLVTQADDGRVTIYYESPRFVADRHDIQGQSDRIEAIANRLAALADTAAGRSTPGPGAGAGQGTVLTAGPQATP
ncbi:hypothetical protein T31B1_02210 [Salinisphaera sp. T31B1]